MKTDVALHPGDRKKPAVVFVHGLGMDKNIWVTPEKSRILGGMFPVDVLLNRQNATGTKSTNHALHETLYHDLTSMGYSCITWSQKRPAGPMAFAVSEMQEIVGIARGLTEMGIVIVGHSRGGLIARRHLMTDSRSVMGLLTICTPHLGSSIARIGEYLSPLASLVPPIIPGKKKGMLLAAIKRVADFLRSGAFLELLPESEFFRTLTDSPLEQTVYESFGGTVPTLFSVGGFSFPDVLEKIVPARLYPEELRKGRGDGLVSAESSRLPWARQHSDFPCNHAEMLFDKRARASAVKSIEHIR